MKKQLKVIISLILIIAIFFVGFIIGNNNRKLDYILDIDQRDVKTFFINNKIMYESNELSNINDDQEVGWNLLIEQISMVGYERHKTKGSTAHTKYKIEMKNGDIYYIEHLGCLHQVDITYPNGKTKKYYAYN